MKRRLGLMIAAFSVSLGALALNDFGEFGAAKAAHPEFFGPGVHPDAVLGSTPWYVYCGEAEKCFSEETDSELYEEAEIQAKRYFYEYFKKDDPQVKVEVIGAHKLYQYADGKMRYVVVGVPKSDVKVIHSPVPAAPKPQPVPAPAVTHAPAATPEPVKAPTPVAAPVKASVPVAAPEPAVAPESAKTVPSSHEEMDDDAKLMILRSRLEKNPGDFRTRIRMARIFDRQGNVKRALRNYNDAARLLVEDVLTASREKAPDLREIAQYEEDHGAGSLALKHYRALQRLRLPEDAAYATRRISELLLHYH